MTRRMLLMLILAAAMVAATSWLSRQSGAPDQTSTTAKSSEPDYFIRGLEATITGTDGSPRHRLNAEELTHYPDGDLTTLQTPAMTVFRDDGDLWQLKAKEGEARGGMQQLTLSDSVVLAQTGKQPFTLETERLQIDTERRYAESDAAVTLRAPSSTIEGVGMQAFAEEQRLRLLNSVRGRYATP